MIQNKHLDLNYQQRLKLREVGNDQLKFDNDKTQMESEKISKWYIFRSKNNEVISRKSQCQSINRTIIQVRQLSEIIIGREQQISCRNKQLLKQIKQIELYVQEVKSMYDRE
ncbi:unnamed protein product [Paramecium primaurelia]|uniref:Uncharacterized protein n=1 Tax=Paramecium primaurelia TaxID=5886 RepID=A0A8S1PMX5_PARPR|nr:unnamed protein product [Paramecium primaurelia]